MPNPRTRDFAAAWSHQVTKMSQSAWNFSMLPHGGAINHDRMNMEKRGRRGGRARVRKDIRHARRPWMLCIFGMLKLPDRVHDNHNWKNRMCSSPCESLTHNTSRSYLINAHMQTKRSDACRMHDTNVLKPLVASIPGFSCYGNLP